MSTILSFKSIKNKHDVCRGKDFMKKFYKSLIENAMEIINFKKKNIRSLISKQQKSYQNAEICYICKEKFEDKHAKDKKNIVKLGTIVIIKGNMVVLHSYSA